MKSIQFDLEDLPHGKIFVIHYKEYKELDSHLLFKYLKMSKLMNIKNEVLYFW